MHCNICLPLFLPSPPFSGFTLALWVPHAQDMGISALFAFSTSVTARADRAGCSSWEFRAGNSELGIQPRSPGLEKVLATPGTVISWAWRPSLAGKRCPQILRGRRPLSEGFSLSDPTDLCQSLLDSVRSSAQPPKEGGVTA